MKKNKIFAIAMVMVVMFALAACGNKVEDTNKDVNSENTLETEEDVDEAIDVNEGETKEKIEKGIGVFGL